MLPLVSKFIIMARWVQVLIAKLDQREMLRKIYRVFQIEWDDYSSIIWLTIAVTTMTQLGIRRETLQVLPVVFSVHTMSYDSNPKWYEILPRWAVVLPHRIWNSASLLCQGLWLRWCIDAISDESPAEGEWCQGRGYVVAKAATASIQNPGSC